MSGSGSNRSKQKPAGNKELIAEVSPEKCPQFAVDGLESAKKVPKRAVFTLINTSELYSMT